MLIKCEGLDKIINADFLIETFPKNSVSDSDHVLKVITHLPTGTSMAISGTNLETNEKIKEWIRQSAKGKKK